MEDPLVETWLIHDRINLYLLDAIPPDALGVSLNPKMRSVFKIFAHVHNVRLMWIKSAAPDLLPAPTKIESDVGNKEELAANLVRSGEAVAELLRRSVANGGKVKGFKPHVTAFLGYLISHESHHRGQVGWTLKATGHALPQKVAFGLWEWGFR